MIFNILGFLLTSFIGAVALIYKLTGDIAPIGLKRFLYQIALRNWKLCQPKRMNLYDASKSTCTKNSGILPSPEEDILESPKDIKNSNESDDLAFYGIDDNGNGFYVRIIQLKNNLVEAFLYLSLNGVSYSVSRQGRRSSRYDFALGNFKLEMVESMRCWRIWYNGILRDENNGTTVHAILNFLWKAFDVPLDTKRDINTKLLSENFARTGNFGSNLFDFPNILPDGYIQFGALHGTIRIDEKDENRLYLYGFRSREWNSFLQTFENFVHRKDFVELFGMSGCDGKTFRIHGRNGGWIDGHVLHPSNKKFSVTNLDVSPQTFLHNSSIPKLFNITDGNSNFLVEIWPNMHTHKFLGMEIVLLTLTMNGKHGRGILLRATSNSTKSSRFSSITDTTILSLSNNAEKEVEKVDEEYWENEKTLKKISNMDEVPEIVPFSSEFCKIVSIVGGKGASLAELNQASNNNKEFNTAKGFCVTTSAFRKYLPLDIFEKLFSECEDTKLDDICFEVMKIIKSSEAKKKIEPLLASWIKNTFGNDQDGLLRLAVRSSGILEDGSELSCAGQNESFLGILSNDVAEKVVDCWASLYTPQSVRYRLNHGQPAMSEVGVVVQEMVNAYAAGVLFTAHPQTGNPFKIMISANYGLGESVVSAACDPDTIIINRSSDDDEFVISDKYLGKKKTKIILSPNAFSTSEVELNSKESESFSINDSVALDLCRIGVKIEKELGELKPVDIEWSLDEGGRLYILQCRPITSLDLWTDFELIHESDSPYNTTFERITHANTGEVMPGAISPLNVSIFVKVLDVGIQSRTKGYAVPYSLQNCIVSRNRVLLNILNIMYRRPEKEITVNQIASDLAIFGHRIFSEELHALAVERHGITPPLTRLRELKGYIMNIFKSQGEMERANKIYSNFTISLGKNPQDPKQVYDVITEKIYDLYGISLTHCIMSESSSVTQMFALLTLAQGRKAEDWDSDIYEDVSKVLSVCMDVESADLPSAMDRLAVAVGNYGGTQDEIMKNFIETLPNVAYDWLNSHENSIISNSLSDFFEKHGHRCISELELMRKSWRSDPIPFVTLLQSLVRNKLKYENRKTNEPKVNFKDDEALLQSLHTSISRTAKLFLKFLLPYCRRAVWNREKTKSLLVRTGDQLKQAYVILGKIMVKQKLIPDTELLYFMSHHQIGQIINRHHSTPKILYKAMRKMKLHPMLSKEEYPEVTIGIREPVERNFDIKYGDILRGTPVSSGKVQAPVKVCMNIEEASQMIEPGDILITHGTDIGWSPFFPVLGGIVTELGGLISHGAVVAREYGLPCIVGAENATRMFKTGELAILDAGKGTLTKVLHS